MATAISKETHCDPIIRAVAVEKFTDDYDIRNYEHNLREANKVYIEMQEAILQQEINREAAEKKLRENDAFFKNAFDNEVSEKLLTLVMLEYQNALNEEFVEEMERLINKELEQLKLRGETTIGEVSPEMKAIIENQALASSIKNVENKINKLNDKIASIEKSWGAPTWEEGQRKHAAALAHEFGKNLPEGVDYDSLPVKSRVRVSEAVKACQKELEQKLAERIDPEKLQIQIAKSYTPPNAPDAPGPPTMMPPQKPYVIGYAKTLTSMEHLFAARKLQNEINKVLPADKKLNMNIGQLAKYAEQGPGLKEYFDKVDQASKLTDLKNARKELLNLANDLKSLVDAKKNPTPGLR